MKYHPVELAVARYLGRKPDIHVIIPLRTAFKGLIDVEGHIYRNMLVGNWWKMLCGVLANQDVSMIKTSAGQEAMRTSGDYSRNAAVVRFGDNTTPPSWTDYKILGSAVGEGDILSPNYFEDTDKFRFEFNRVVNAEGVREVALYHDVYDYGGGSETVMYGRRVLDAEPSVGQTVIYRILVHSPWVRQAAALLYALLTHQHFAPSEGIKDIDGYTYTQRYNDPNAGNVKLNLGTGSNSWSPGDYALTDAVELEQSLIVKVEYGYAYLTTIGVKRLESNITFNELGWYQELYDEGGTKHICLINRIVLDTPVSKSANELISAALTIYAYAT